MNMDKAAYGLAKRNEEKISAIKSRPGFSNSKNKDIPTMAIPPTVTIADTSQISGSVITAAYASAVVNPIYSYGIGTIVRGGTTYPKRDSVIQSAVTTTLTTSNMEVEFGFYGDEFEIYEYGATSWYRILVDEGDGFQYVSKTAIATLTNGSLKFRKVAFASVGLRRIKLETSNLYFFGVYCKPIHTVFKSDSFNVKNKCVILGDSFVEGSAAGFAFDGFAYTISKNLGFDLLASGSGGTGYISTGLAGRVKYRDRIQTDLISLNPDVAIIMGGVNDYSFLVADLVEEADLLYTQIRSSAVIKPIVVLPFFVGNQDAKLLSMSDGLRDLCIAKKIPCIDVARGDTYDKYGNKITSVGLSWFAGTGKVGTATGNGNADLFKSSDGTHPTLEGHLYLGNRLSFEISKILNVI